MVKELEDAFPGSSHIRDYSLERADDETIWRFAREKGFTIVSKDAEFHQRSFLLGAPPKVVWLRLGNSSTQKILQTLRENDGNLRAFDANPDASFLVLS